MKIWSYTVNTSPEEVINMSDKTYTKQAQETGN